MAVVLTPRAERLLARFPRLNIYSGLELLLLVLLAVQCARLFWSLLTPLGPLGEWKALDLIRPVAPAAALTSFDPFFRQAPGAAAVAPEAAPTITALNIRLFGVSANQATGGGTAIIGTPDGQQYLFALGDEVAPGVVLTGVGSDFVTISRGGAAERLYLDQSASSPQPNSPGIVSPPVLVPPAPPAPAPLQRQASPPQPVPTVPAQPQPEPQAAQLPKVTQ